MLWLALRALTSRRPALPSERVQPQDVALFTEAVEAGEA